MQNTTYLFVSSQFILIESNSYQRLIEIQNPYGLKSLGFLNTVNLKEVKYSFPPGDVAIADNLEVRICHFFSPNSNYEYFHIN